MEALLAGDDAFLGKLREQLEVASPSLRDMTGSGFFLEFAVPADAPRVVPSRFILGDVTFEIESLEHGGGAILHGKNGELGVLEAYSNAGSWPSDLGPFQVSYFGGSRDLPGLMKEVHGR